MFERLFVQYNRWLLITLLAAMVVVVFANVGMRYLLGTSVIWSEEVARHLMIWLTFSFLIGHITKEGSLAGPKSLEHMVDVMFLFEGERDHSHRVLRALKNRFGPVSELAIFEMAASGLQAISNPSAFFLKERPANEAGSVVVATLKGSRPLLIEIQSLVSSTLFASNPPRMTVGLDHFRTAMLLAVIEKKLGYGFGGDDIYLNAGRLTGLKVGDVMEVSRQGEVRGKIQITAFLGMDASMGRLIDGKRPEGDDLSPGHPQMEE